MPSPRTAPNQSQRPGFFGRRVKRRTDCETYQSKPKPATGLLRSTAVVRDHSGDSDNHTKASDRASSVDITDGRRYCSILDTPSQRPGFFGRFGSRTQVERTSDSHQASDRASSVDGACIGIQTPKPAIRPDPHLMTATTPKPATGLLRSTVVATRRRAANTGLTKASDRASSVDSLGSDYKGEQSQRPGFFGRHGRADRLRRSDAANQSQRPGFFRPTVTEDDIKLAVRALSTDHIPPRVLPKTATGLLRLLADHKPKPATGLLRSTAQSSSRLRVTPTSRKASDRASSVDGSWRPITVNQSQRPGFFGRRGAHSHSQPPIAKPAIGLLRSTWTTLGWASIQR